MRDEARVRTKTKYPTPHESQGRSLCGNGPFFLVREKVGLFENLDVEYYYLYWHCVRAILEVVGCRAEQLAKSVPTLEPT